MIRTSSIDTVQRNKLESLIRSGLSKFTYIHDIKFADDMKKTLIYPTMMFNCMRISSIHYFIQ